MKRRTAALLTACMGWSVASMAGAQTTSTSTSNSTSSSTTSTSTTVVNPCAGQICTDRPPPAFLSGPNGEVALDEGGSCWRSPQPNAAGQLTAVCVDKVPSGDPVALLVVTAGETLTLRFGSMVPTEVVFVDDGRSTALTPGNPIRLDANLSVGIHRIAVLTRWLQGDASYGLRLDVRTAGRPLALTG
jgi:hypothetical protein